MRIIKLFLCLFAFTFSFTSFIHADAQLDNLKAIYNKEMAKIEEGHFASLLTVQNAYKSYLDGEMAKATNKGDLKKYSEIEKEKKRFEKEKTIPDNSPVADRLAVINKQKSAQVVDLTNKYVSGLNKHKIALMKAKNIEEAKIVQAEIDKAKSAASTLEKDISTPSKKSKPTTKPRNLLITMKPQHCKLKKTMGVYQLSDADMKIRGQMRGLVTIENYSPSFSLKMKVKTDSTNIRCYYGDVVGFILNWESRQSELRVSVPTWQKGIGVKGKGYVTPNEWHDVTWNINEDDMIILVDGEERYKGHFDFSTANDKLGVSPAWGSTIEVKNFTVEEK